MKRVTDRKALRLMKKIVEWALVFLITSIIVLVVTSIANRNSYPEWSNDEVCKIK